MAVALGIAERVSALVPVDGFAYVQRAHPRAERPTGRLRTVSGRSRASGPGVLKRFSVAVEGGLHVDRRTFASTVRRILFDERGWSGGAFAFRRVDSNAAIRIALTSPRTTDRLCAPLDTRGRFSCHRDGLVALNVWRWRHGARDFERLARYRKYLVNHEVGHALGHAHASCPRAGARAPVMMQQTEGVGTCRPNPWPLGYEH